MEIKQREANETNRIAKALTAISVVFDRMDTQGLDRCKAHRFLMICETGGIFN